MELLKMHDANLSSKISYLIYLIDKTFWEIVPTQNKSCYINDTIANVTHGAGLTLGFQL